MRRFTWLPLLGVILLGMPGCRDSSTDDPDKLTIAVIPKCSSAEFWKTVEEGAREAADELGVEMKWEGTVTETEVAEQNRIIENMINLEVSGIALAPLNRKAMRKTVERAVAAGIPVMIFDSAVDGDAQVGFVATDNVQGGRMGAEHLLELLGNKQDAEVAVFRFVQGTASTEARAEGFIETSKAAGVKIVADPYPEDGTVAGCTKTAANTLEGFIRNRRLELDGIFCCNDRATLGALSALEDMRKSGVEVDVKFVGFDFAPKLIDALQAGELDALVAQNPRKMGYLAVARLVDHLRGKKIEKFIDTGAVMVTRQSLEEDAEIRKLVGLE